MRSIWINKNYIAKIASTVTGGIYAFIGFIGMLVTHDEIISDKMSILVRSIISISVLTGIWCCCFIIVSVILMNKKRFKVLSANNGHALYLQYGDIFNANEVREPSKRRNIVIPVNRCFDTHVDNHIVSEQTLHGIAFKKLYASGGNENEHYFLWALSTFDSNLKAHTSMQEYALAVQRLIESCNTESEGFSIVLPLVGTGLSRTKRDQQDVLQYLINAFRVNKDQINCDIHIVVHEDVKNEIAIMSIK